MARVKTPSAASKNANTEPSEVKAAPAAPSKTKSKVPAAPSFEAIAQRAYEIFQARGGEHGRHDEDWKQAERELKLGPQ